MQQLGAEEHQLHKSTLQVQGEVKALLASVAQNPEAKDRQLQRCMAQLRANIRDFELLAEEQDTDEQACAVEQLLRHHKAEYESLRASISAAKLAAKQAAEVAFAQQRKELLSGAALPTLQRSMGSEAQAAEGAQAITESLRRSRMALAQQLDQTTGNLEVTESGSARLSTTKEELSGQEGLFKDSRQGLKDLRKQSSGDRWLLWVGLSLFLTVAAYIAYKRAPAAAKLPVDAVLGVVWRLLRAAAGVLAFVGQTLMGLVLRGGSAAILAVRNARSSSGSSSSSSTILHAPGKPLHLQAPVPAPHSQPPSPPPASPHWEAALNEGHETDGLVMAPDAVLEQKASGVDGVHGPERDTIGHGVDGSKGKDGMAGKGRDTDGGADEGVEVGDGTGSSSSSFDSSVPEGVLDMSRGLHAFQDVSEGFGFVGPTGDEGAKGAAIVGGIEGSKGVQHAEDFGRESGGEEVTGSIEQEGLLIAEVEGEAGAGGEVQGLQAMDGELGGEMVGEGGAEPEGESSRAAQKEAQEEDKEMGGGQAGEMTRGPGVEWVGEGGAEHGEESSKAAQDEESSRAAQNEAQEENDEMGGEEAGTMTREPGAEWVGEGGAEQEGVSSKAAQEESSKAAQNEAQEEDEEMGRRQAAEKRVREHGAERVGEGGAEQEGESSTAAQKEAQGKDKEKSGGNAEKLITDDDEGDSTMDGKVSGDWEAQGHAADEEERENVSSVGMREEGAASGNASDRHPAAKARSAEKPSGVTTDAGGAEGEGGKGRQQAGRAGVGEAAVGDKAGATADEKATDEEVRTLSEVKVGPGACDAKPGVRDVQGECARRADSAEAFRGKEVDEKEEPLAAQQTENGQGGEPEGKDREAFTEEAHGKEGALAAQQTESDQEVEPEERDGTASTEDLEGDMEDKDGAAPADQEHGKDEERVASGEGAMRAGAGDQKGEGEPIDEHASAAGESTAQDREGADSEDERESDREGEDATGGELDQARSEQGNTRKEPEVEQQGGAPAAEADEAEEGAAAKAAAPWVEDAEVEDAAKRGGGASAYGRLKEQEAENLKQKVEEEERQEEQEEGKKGEKQEGAGEDKGKGGQRGGEHDAFEQHEGHAEPASGTGKGSREASASEEPPTTRTAENVAKHGSDAKDWVHPSPKEQLDVKRQQAQQEEPQQHRAQLAADTFQSQVASHPAFPGVTMSKKWPDEFERKAAIRRALEADSAAATAGRASSSSGQQQQQQWHQLLQGLREGDAGMAGWSERGHAGVAKPHEAGRHQEEQHHSSKRAEGLELEGHQEEVEGLGLEGAIEGDEHSVQGLPHEKQRQQQRQEEQGNRDENEPLENGAHAQLGGGGKNGPEEGKAAGAEGGSSQLNGEVTEHLQRDIVVEGKGAVEDEGESQKGEEPAPAPLGGIVEEEGQGEEEPGPEPTAESGGEDQEPMAVQDGSIGQAMERADFVTRRKGGEAHDWALLGMGQKQEGGSEKGQRAESAEKSGMDVSAGALEDNLGDHSLERDIQSGSIEPGSGPEKAEKSKEVESMAGGSLGQRIGELAVENDRDVPARAASGVREFSNSTNVGGPEGLGFSKGRAVGAKENGGGGEDDKQLQQPLQASTHGVEDNHVETAREGGKQLAEGGAETEKGPFHFPNASIGAGQR